MKIPIVFIGAMLCSGLTSCWQASHNVSSSPFAKPVQANNIIYLHATRNQDIQNAFTDYITAGKVVVDFYADWCRPCQLMGNVIQQVASAFPSIIFLKVNVDECQVISTDIRSLPTLYFYKNGTQIKKITGLQDKGNFVSLLKTLY